MEREAGNKKKIGIATLFTGYNFGSALQAFATKEVLHELGYEPELLKIKGSLIAGRDVRIKKAFVILWRSFIHGNLFKSVSKYKKALSSHVSKESVSCFRDFFDQKLSPKYFSYSQLKKLAYRDEYYKFLCGSDQIWNALAWYVDPFYFLRFAPQSKRIAFSPSFGRDFVPAYNQRIFKKYISQIDHLSVRETSGKEIISALIGKNAEVLIDPTLVLDKQEWTEKLHLTKLFDGEKYILVYFLNAPGKTTITLINELSEKLKAKIVAVPYAFDDVPWNESLVDAGPKEFVNLVKNATFVCTDSFHGTAFSINFNVPFYTFQRNYSGGDNQSARIESILAFTDLLSRFEPKTTDNCLDISFHAANAFLKQEREHSKSYLMAALEGEAYHET